MKYNLIDRRMFLQGSGGFLFAIPFLPSLLIGREARAAGAPTPKYLQITHEYGAHRSSVYPTSNLLATDASIGGFGKTRALSEMISRQGRIGDTFGSWFNNNAKWVNLIYNIHCYFSNSNHHHSLVTTGSGSPRGVDNTEDAVFPFSADYVIEKALGVKAVRGYVNGAHTFSFGGGDGCMGPSYTNYSQLKNNLAAGTGSIPTQGVSEKASILNRVMEDYKRVRNNARISALDKTRLDSFVAMINDMVKQETGSNNPPPVSSCSVAGPADTGDGFTKEKNTMELLASAFACGGLRVAAHGLNPDIFNTNHDKHHNVGNSDHDEAMRQCTRIVAHFIDKAASIIDESGKPLIENMIVLYAPQFGSSGDAPGQPNEPFRDGHSMDMHHAILAGGGAGRLRTGSLLDAGHAPWGRLLVTVFHAMGLNYTQYEKNGNQGFGQYDLEHISNDNKMRVGGYDYGTLNRFLTTSEKRTALPLFKG